MIEGRALRKSFGSVQAVEGVTFTAQDGAVTGFLGPNGAGKTTTLRMLSGLVVPDAGELYVDGESVQEAPQRALKRLGILPDLRGLYPRLTAREHLQYFGRLHGLSEVRLSGRISQLAELLQMEKILERRVAGFSQGERTKVAIARALVHDPPNVVLDEPTNGLDVMSTRALRGVIAQLAQEGRCVIFSSHIMAEVAAVCDQIVVFAGGRVVAAGTPSVLMAASGGASLEEAFVEWVGEPKDPGRDAETAG